jgi:hypothetical protein
MDSRTIDGVGEERSWACTAGAPTSVVPDTENRSGWVQGWDFFGSAEGGVEGVRGVGGDCGIEEEEDAVSVVVDVSI